MPDILEIEKVSRVEFADIVKSTHLIDYKLRIILIDNSEQVNVEASPFPLNLMDGFKAFLEFVRDKLIH